MRHIGEKLVCRQNIYLGECFIVSWNVAIILWWILLFHYSKYYLIQNFQPYIAGKSEKYYQCIDNIFHFFREITSCYPKSCITARPHIISVSRQHAKLWCCVGSNTQFSQFDCSYCNVVIKWLLLLFSRKKPQLILLDSKCFAY